MYFLLKMGMSFQPSLCVSLPEGRFEAAFPQIWTIVPWEGILCSMNELSYTFLFLTKSHDMGHDFLGVGEKKGSMCFFQN